MMNYLQTTTKKTKAPPASTSQAQGNTKKTKTTKLNTPAAPEETVIQTTLNPAAPEWTQPTTKNARNMENKKQKAKATTSSLLSDSETDSDAEASDSVVMIPEKQFAFLLEQSITFRYTLTLEVDNTLEPTPFLKSSIDKVNKVLKRLTIDGQLSGYAGKAVVIPWEDSTVYSNRAWVRIKRSTEHAQLLPFVKDMLYGYGAPKGWKQDNKLAKKYCRINISWISPESLDNDKLNHLQQFLYLLFATMNRNPTHFTQLLQLQSIQQSPFSSEIAPCPMLVTGMTRDMKTVS
jgi:hypothetical protein